MILKLLQLNIFKGAFLPEVIDYVRAQNIDILQFQEVSGGLLSDGGTYNIPGVEKQTAREGSDGIDTFQELIKKTHFSGELVSTFKYTKDSDSYFGNATLVNPKFAITNKDVIWLKDFMEIEPDFNDWEQVGRAALVIELDIYGKPLYCINVHMAWGPHPNDEDYKIEQAQKLLEYVKTLKKPFILTGDFNVKPDTKTSGMFEEIGKNLLKESQIPNTLNPNIHPVKQLFPPGLPVDYVFTHPDIVVKDFKLVDSPDLSDHFGLLLTFEM